MRRLSLAVLWLALACAGDEAAPPASVILVSVDTLRADRLGVYGHPRPISPRIDAFAADAVVFDACFAHSSETRFSVASLLTGFLPHETGVTEGEQLPAEVETLAEILGRHGFATAAVVSNYVLRGARGWSQGFDVYDDEMTSREVARDWPERTAGDTTDRAIELLEELRGLPFLLWIHYQDPHGPYTPPEAYRELFRDPDRPPRHLPLNRGIRGIGGIPSYQRLGGERDFHYYVSQYEGEIRYLDEEFGRLLDALRGLGLYEDSLLVFTADHGESLGEHGQYFAHMEYLYGELTRVPLILRLGAGAPGRRAERVQHADLLPTILGFLGLPAPAGLRGRDLRGAGGDAPEIYAEIDLPFLRGGRRSSLVWEGHRLVRSLPGGRLELYDLEADPGENRDLAGEAAQARRLAEMERRLLRLDEEDRLGISTAETAPPLSDDEREKLEALGYVRD